VITNVQEWIELIDKCMYMWRLMCKNLEYISLLQSRAMLAEPSKMHRNRPLAVHPATVVVVVVASIVANIGVFVLFIVI
jgi:hypothetical protein